MNKVKIVNEDIALLMQSKAKQFQVIENSKLCSPTSKRPKTPHQIFRSVIKEAAEAELHFKKLQRNKAASANHTKRVWRPQSYEPSSAGQKIFFDISQRKYRPSTADYRKRAIKMLPQKQHQKQDIRLLKKEIAEVFSQIQVQSSLQKSRLKNRYVEYGLKKFGRYWAHHKVSLNKKTIVDISSPIPNIHIRMTDQILNK